MLLLPGCRLQLSLPRGRRNLLAGCRVSLRTIESGNQHVIVFVGVIEEVIVATSCLGVGRGGCTDRTATIAAWRRRLGG